MRLTELIRLGVRLDLRGLLIEPTSNVAVQAFRGLFAGAVALAADAGVLWLLSLTGL
jgi:hypothetical protein